MSIVVGRTRTAGDLNNTSELKSYGSNRSFKYERSNSIIKHDDLFSSSLNARLSSNTNRNSSELFIEPVKDFAQAAAAAHHSASTQNLSPTTNNSEEKEKIRRDKRRSKHHHHHHPKKSHDGSNEAAKSDDLTPEEKEKLKRERRERRKQREREKQLREEQKLSQEKSKKDETTNDELDYLESLKNFTRRNRERRASVIENNKEKSEHSEKPKESRKRVENSENNNTPKPKPPLPPSSSSNLNRHSSVKNITDKHSKTTAESSGEAGTRRRSNSFVKMNAFELPLKPDSEAEDLDEKENGGELKVDVDLIKESTRVFNLIDDSFFKSIYDGDTLDFLLTPAPPGQLINCKIFCQKGLITDYFFHVEKIGMDNANLLLMKASRKLTTTKSNYTIIPVNHNMTSGVYNSGVSCARFASNMGKKKFRLEINGANLAHLDSEQILDVVYSSFPNEPTQITANATLCAGNRNKKDKVTYFLKNAKPYYDVERKKYVLNYNGRAKRSSKHNFQIVDKSQPDVCIMQLGKIDSFIFNCDFSYPLCALQAFAFGLSSLTR
jgi:hypothetical protein